MQLICVCAFVARCNDHTCEEYVGHHIDRAWRLLIGGSRLTVAIWHWQRQKEYHQYRYGSAFLLTSSPFANTCTCTCILNLSSHYCLWLSALKIVAIERFRSFITNVGWQLMADSCWLTVDGWPDWSNAGIESVKTDPMQALNQFVKNQCRHCIGLNYANAVLSSFLNRIN